MTKLSLTLTGGFCDEPTCIAPVQILAGALSLAEHKGCGVRGSQLSADLTFRQGSWRWDWPWPILTGTHLVT